MRRLATGSLSYFFFQDSCKLMQKKSEPQIIIGGGFGSSGLSALMDLLREVEGVFITPQEFAMFNDPDGLISLESAILDNWSIFQGNVAITRFRNLALALNKKYRNPYPGLAYSRYLGKAFLSIDAFRFAYSTSRWRPPAASAISHCYPRTWAPDVLRSSLGCRSGHPAICR